MLNMITIWCSVIKSGKMQNQKKFTSSIQNMNDAFLECMQNSCKYFDLEMPMWHTKHTKELNQFRKITFLKDDFIDEIPYDKFVVEITEFN